MPSGFAPARKLPGWRRIAVLLLPALVAAPFRPAAAEDPPPAERSAAAAAPAAPAAPTTTLEPVVVTAQKLLEDAQDVPMSLTVVGGSEFDAAGLRSVKEAAARAPATVIQEFTARKLSFPYVRGVGSGPQNPSVTTFIDGVPQLHATSSSVELLDVERIEFLRGPQGALYGRNTLGGLVHVVSRPPPDSWEAGLAAELGDYGRQDYRFHAGGPARAGRIGVSLAGGWGRRDGYAENQVTGHDLDSREAFFGRGKIEVSPDERWRVTAGAYGERARDGDYALADLAFVRGNPHEVRRDFEGYTRRDVVAPTLTVERRGRRIDFTSITGLVKWNTEDLTDLDATESDLLVRRNREEFTQFTQEFRLASARRAPLRLAERVYLSWLAGAFVFTANYNQDATNALSAAAAAGVGVPFAFEDRAGARLDDVVGAIFGSVTLGIAEQVDLTAGVRGDYEDKRARLQASTAPAITAHTRSDLDDAFAEVTPRFAAAWHATERVLVYASAAKGFKAGGFNAGAPAGAENFDPERAWTYEVGAKTSWCDDRVTANAALFYLDWEELQLDVPNPTVPGRFFVANVGEAVSRGFELEAAARVCDPITVFTGLGLLDGRFRADSRASGAHVGGNDLPFAPAVTWNAGVAVERAVASGVTAFVRAETVFTDDYAYDASNAARQQAFFLTHLRAGVRGARWRVEGWVKNLADTEYEPIAFPFTTSLAASGYVAESGAPRTFGVTLSFEF